VKNGDRLNENFHQETIFLAATLQDQPQWPQLVFEPRLLGANHYANEVAKNALYTAQEPNRSWIEVMEMGSVTLIDSHAFTVNESQIVSYLVWHHLEKCYILF